MQAKLTKTTSDNRQRPYKHFQFSDNTDIDIEQQKGFSLTDHLIKKQQQQLNDELKKKNQQRQMQQLEEQKMLQATIKRHKQDHVSHFSFEATSNQFQIAQEPKDPNARKKQAPIRKTWEEKLKLNLQFQEQTVSLLSQLLCHIKKQKKIPQGSEHFHPAGKTTFSLFNPEILNYWILSVKVTNKIRSFLMLYMILHDFEHIQWKFKKTFNRTASQNRKSIEVQQIIKSKSQPRYEEVREKIQIKGEKYYQNYIKNEVKSYLSLYVQWVIWLNRSQFEQSEGDEQFWALAFNETHDYIDNLLISTNPLHAVRDRYLALFLSNIQDPIFRSSIQIPMDLPNINYITKQKLDYLPECHWLLKLNVSTKYFIVTDLKERIKNSLAIDGEEQMKNIADFDHEYRLLNLEYSDGNIQIEKYRKWSLGDYILTWLLIQQSNVSFQDKTLRSQIIKQICIGLLGLSNDSSQKLKNMLLVCVQLLQNEQFLNISQKIKLISDILYQNEKVAYKHSSFFSVIQQLEKVHQTILPKLSQILTLQFNDYYKYLILSNQKRIQYHPLQQLKYLTQISLKFRNKETAQRIYEIITDFTLLSHWNKKDVTAKLSMLIDGYLTRLKDWKHQKFQPYSDRPEQIIQEQQGKQNDPMNYQKQIEELSALNKLLKVHLKQSHMTFNGIINSIKLIQQAQARNTLIYLNDNSIHFLRQVLLSEVMNKSGKNESLIAQIRKNHSERALNQNKNQQISILDDLQALSKGIQYFQSQIQLLKQEDYI